MDQLADRRGTAEQAQRLGRAHAHLGHLVAHRGDQVLAGALGAGQAELFGGLGAAPPATALQLADQSVDVAQLVQGAGQLLVLGATDTLSVVEQDLLHDRAVATPQLAAESRQQ